MLVTFANTNVRNKIFSKKKQLKDHAKRVYIYEHLTKHRASLFKKARQFVKEKKIQATWVYKGKNYPRRQHAEVSEDQNTCRDLKQQRTKSTTNLPGNASSPL
jgi:hypothetical protein